MKKRTGSVLLAGAMLLGLCYPLAACTITTEGSGHSHTYASDWTWDSDAHWHAATCEHTTEKADRAAHSFNEEGSCTVCGYAKVAEKPEDGDRNGGGDTPEVPDANYKPGDVVTDQKVRDALNQTLRELSFAGMGATFDADFIGAAESIPFVLDLDGKATFAHSDGWTADIGVTEHGLLSNSYVLAYLRENASYFGYGVWEDKKQDYDAQLEKYREADGPALIGGEYADDSVDMPGFAQAELLPVLSKLAKNSLVYAGGDIVKTQSGYEMSIDLSGTIDKILGDVQAAFENYEGTIEIAGVKIPSTNPGYATLQEMIEQPSIANMLDTLLYGISAQELVTLLQFIVPEDTMSAFPEAKADMDAMDYIDACLASPELAQLALAYYGEMTGNNFNYDFTDSGIGSIQVMAVWFVVFNKTFVQSEVVADIQSLRDDFEGMLLSALLGENAEGKLSMVATAHFDEEYALTDVDLDSTFDRVKGDISYPDESGELNTVSVLLDGTVHANIIFMDTAPTLADLTGVNVLPFESLLPPMEDPEAPDDGLAEAEEAEENPPEDYEV